MGVLYQRPDRTSGPGAGSLEGHGEYGREPRSVRRAGRPDGGLRFRRHRLRSYRIRAGGGRNRWRRPDRAVVLGSGLLVADDPARLIPLAHFQRSEPAYVLSLLCTERNSVLLPTRLNTSTRLLGDASVRCPSSIHFAYVLALPLVRWTSGSIWRENSAGRRTAGCRSRSRALCNP